MPKNINIKAHVDRYQDTEVADIVKLIEGLTDLLENQKVRNIEKLRKQLAALENGEIPQEEPVAEASTPKRTRGGKKVTQQATDDL